MILNNTPENNPVLSNVGEIGEFRIRNSAKAFTILSSSLYANKIRAIIRELSCNAVDSHAAAGCTDRPFEVHLPNALEPWFSIRDYGVGLSHDQVINIYTTYFESTKTDSNQFIGALGLGSKSPFSYTENFSVTAIQNGRQGIYTAFINSQGVPSIALMTESVTDQPNGVEVKFSVNDYSDYAKFRTEAAEVYRWFAQLPTITGSTMTIKPVAYERQNLIPGVHVLEHVSYHYASSSYAIMGNIAYPIQVPNSESNLGSLHNLLHCGLVMHFDIGELDFQASREGLSYIPQTIDAIRHKLKAVNDTLGVTLAQEVDAIDNLWERSYYLEKKRHHALWKTACEAYMQTHNSVLKPSNTRYGYPQFAMNVPDLASTHNIVVKSFEKNSRHRDGLRIRHAERTWANNSDQHIDRWSFGVHPNTHFVINDLKTGAFERAKYHWRQEDLEGTVFVLEAADKNKPMLTGEFFQSISNPPSAQIHQASTLEKREKAARKTGVAKDATILRLEKRGGNRRWSASDDLVWRTAEKLAEFDSQKQYLYVPLNGFELISGVGATDIKQLLNWVTACGLFGGQNLEVYGVRKADLPQVQACSNWKNFEDFIRERLNNAPESVILGIVVSKTDNLEAVLRQAQLVSSNINDASPLKTLEKRYHNMVEVRFSEQALTRLHSMFGATAIPQRIKILETEAKQVVDRYPLLAVISGRHAAAVAEYVNLIDEKKGC